MILPSASLAGGLLAAAAAVAYVLAAIVVARGGARGLGPMVPAWGLHAAALAWGLLGSQPHFGFAPALSKIGRAHV